MQKRQSYNLDVVPTSSPLKNKITTLKSEVKI